VPLPYLLAPPSELDWVSISGVDACCLTPHRYLNSTYATNYLLWVFARGLSKVFSSVGVFRQPSYKGGGREEAKHIPHRLIK